MGQTILSSSTYIFSILGVKDGQWCIYSQGNSELDNASKMISYDGNIVYKKSFEQGESTN